MNAQNSVADTWPVVLDSLVDGVVTDLPNTGLPYASTDYTAAMQWVSPVLADGDSFTVLAAVSHMDSFTPCGSQAGSSTFGVGVPGTLGVPEIITVAPPVVGSSGQLLFTNAPAFASGSLLYGPMLLNGSVGVPIFGLNLYVVALGSSPISYDAAGELRLSLPLPLAAAGLCGIPFHFQALVQDPTSGTPFGLSSTAVTRWDIGQ